MANKLSANELLKRLPKVDQVLARQELKESGLPAWAQLQAVRAAIDAKRTALRNGASDDADVLVNQVLGHARALLSPSLRKVVNATGVVLHTNLGRAPLPSSALSRVVSVCEGYSNLEYDIDKRERGSRHKHLAKVLCQLLGCESALVVNNNAAAVLLGLAALAVDGEVVVSRGELVEIGGSFRIPDVMRWSGARLCEVGTTNKTHAKDYEQAIHSDTKLLLKVHQSNFAVVGFTADVSVRELVAIGQSKGLPVMVDLGSGSFSSPGELGAGLPHEPTISETLNAGADLVTFSGDKLLGGPQAGVLVGSANAIEQARRHPLMRTLRPDKLTLAALEATLELYRDGCSGEVPAVAMLSLSPDELKANAQRLAEQLGSVRGVEVSVAETESVVGGGALPQASPRSFALRLTSNERSAVVLDKQLRACEVPVIGKIADDALWLDVRTIIKGEEPLVVRALRLLADT